MAGFWEAIVATHVYNLTTQQLQNINDFTTNIISGVKGGLVLFATAERTLLFNEPHVAGTTGPTTAGWTNGANSTRNFDVSTGMTRNIPNGATAALVQLINSIQSPVAPGTNHSSFVSFANVNAALQGVIPVLFDFATNAAGNIYQDTRIMIAPVPLGTGLMTIRASVGWPVITPAIVNTSVRADLVGYFV